jgi:hypothetical protein
MYATAIDKALPANLGILAIIACHRSVQGWGKRIIDRPAWLTRPA